MTRLALRAFAGGVVLEGSPDMESGMELEAADEFDLGARGALVLASSIEDWISMGGVGFPFIRVGAIAAMKEDTTGSTLAAAGIDVGGNYVVALADRNAAALTTLAAGRVLPLLSPGPSLGDGQMTLVSYPYYMSENVLATPYQSTNQLLVNFGSREGVDVSLSPGLYRVTLFDLAGVATLGLVGLDQFDALGTGVRSESFAGGTKGKRLRFRGIFKYGPIVCGYGMGTAAGGSHNGDNRLMVSNIAKPLKWGRDDQSGGAGDRDYSDIDAMVIGAAGEIIRAGVEWRGRGWLGTNRELHWFSGYGVDHFTTDGTRSAYRQNVLGPHCLMEGPDTLLHGVGTQGHWVFDGSEFALTGRKLFDFSGRSIGWWDLIWSTSIDTNQDMVWLLRDDVAQQVWIVIPRCNATLGYGAGNDSVVIKFDVRSQGYTRQVYLNKRLTAGTYIPRDARAPESRVIGSEAAAVYQLVRYANRATPVSTPVLPSGTPVFQVTRMPDGPEGSAITTFADMTIAWEPAALPLVFSFAMSIDGIPRAAVTATIGPVAPAAPMAGDVWLDTSGSDVALGVAGTAPLIDAEASYVRKVFAWSSWIAVGGGGMKQQRATFGVPFLAAAGARFTLRVSQVSAAGRYQIEALTFDAAAQ